MKLLLLNVMIFSFAISLRADDLFEKEIRPLLIARCYKCHSGTKASGGLSLDTRAGWQKGGESGPAIVPNDADASLLVQAVKQESLVMPPEDEGDKLTDAEIDALTRWINRGAPTPRDDIVRLGGMSESVARSWWAFQPLTPNDRSLTSRDIDKYLDAELDQRSLTPNLQADRRTLIRRATYDLTGLPPTYAHVQQFLNDNSEGAFTRVVDRLLDSPEYGIKWGRHWLDVVRYADTAGENTDRPLPHAWRYRNWVIDATNRDMPYDQFVRMQLAGDILCHDSEPELFRDGIIATGYLAIARRFGHDIDKDIHLMHEDVIDNVGKTFLGLTMGCARCHDHKFDPLTAEDYYALYGIFASTKFAFPGCEPRGQPRDLVPLISAAQIERRQREWQQRNAEATSEQKRRNESVASLTTKLQELARETPRLLATSLVGEGASVSMVDATKEPLDSIALKQGELLRLVVSPNASHGADTTLVAWEIAEVEGTGRKWDVTQLVPDLLSGNPHDNRDDSAWCFLDVTDGPAFLVDKHAKVEGRGELQSWSLGETPSVLVNQSDEPVSVWTTLPPKSFFVHPGVNRDVAIAWIAPADITVRINGHIADAHPAGGDGITFRVEQIASAETGEGLLELGRLLNLPKLEIEPTPVTPVAYAVVEAEAQDARLHLQGDPEKLGEIVPRRWLSLFGGEAVPKESGSGRDRLANWIVDQPISARVMVNRIWQWHFGQGLVSTSNDFGSRGSPPSHPRLLDALAIEFRSGGYRMKAMHRLMMNTAAYRRSSATSRQHDELDVTNQWLARFSRRRMNAEEIRDSLLFVAGNLDMVPAQQHPFPAEATWKFTQHDPFNAVYETNKQSVYLMVQRQRRHPYLSLFDGSDPNASTAIRQSTIVPTQALYFMNSPFFHAQADRLRDRVMEVETEQRLDRAMSLLFQRAATTSDRAAANRFLEKYPGTTDDKWAAYARVMMASNEFLFID